MLPITDQFKQMVKDLSKPGQDILESLTSLKAHLIHMIWGLNGELLETFQALLSEEIDKTNLKEELGDALFFLEGFMQGMSWDISEIMDFVVESDDEYIPEKVYLDSVETISDTMKKHLIYNKTLTDVQILKLKTATANCLVAITSIGLEYEWSFEELLETNMQKLLKGDNARYKSGSYSDQQAKERADKQ